MVGGFLSTSIESSARWSTALGHLQRSMCGSAPTDSIVRQLFALIARCHQIVGDLAAALRVCSWGLRFNPDDAELHFRSGEWSSARARATPRPWCAAKQRSEVNRGASRQAASARRPQLQPGRSQEHRKSRSDNETALGASRSRLEPTPRERYKATLWA